MFRITVRGTCRSGGKVGEIVINDFSETFDCWLPMTNSRQMMRGWMKEIDALVGGVSKSAILLYNPRLAWVLYAINGDVIIRNILSINGCFLGHRRYRKVNCSEWHISYNQVQKFINEQSAQQMATND
jgi:hypothetical protein